MPVFSPSRSIIDLIREPETIEQMARPQVLEGTWEELKLHDEELSGRRFRLVPYT